MKRDWILIKEMLFALEEDRFSEYLNTIELPNSVAMNCKTKEALERAKYIQAKNIREHIDLLKESHIIVDVKTDTENINFGLRLTMEGHDLLDSIRDKAIWNKVVSMAQEAGVALSWEVIKAAIPKAIQSIL